MLTRELNLGEMIYIIGDTYEDGVNLQRVDEEGRLWTHFKPSIRVKTITKYEVVGKSKHLLEGEIDPDERQWLTGADYYVKDHGTFYENGEEHATKSYSIRHQISSFDDRAFETFLEAAEALKTFVE